MGDKVAGWGDELYKWAKDQGIKLEGIGDKVSARAGEIADQGAQTYKDAMAKWKTTYEPLYDAQAADATRMLKELPNTEEQYAGKYGADVAQAFDASREAQERVLHGYGLKAPGSGAQRLDAMAGNQRGLGVVAAQEQGRLAARTEARGVAGQAIQAGLAFPQVAGQGASTSLAGGNQQVGAPLATTAGTAAAYGPSMQAMQTALPYYKQEGDTRSNAYNQQLAKFNAEQSSSGGGIGGMLGGLAGTVAGSFMGPMGGAIGGKLGSSIAGSLFAAEGGAIDDPNAGGYQMVDPSMSRSQGAITDDVPARLNVGEFVMPKDVVEWRGEAWMQKEIMKARKEREQNTVAEPEMGQATAFDTQAPQFQSEGASV
jgi:phage protein U